MAKEDIIEFEGVITDVLPESRYRVKLSNGVEITFRHLTPRTNN